MDGDGINQAFFGKATENKTMKLNEIYTSNSGYLKADDIAGEKPIVTIESITTQTNKDKDSGDPYTQLVLKFVGKEKVLGLNKTNATAIAELLESDETDDWVGKTIQLYTTKVQVGSEQKLGIRVIPVLPPQADFAPPTDDEYAPQHTGVTQAAADSGRW